MGLAKVEINFVLFFKNRLLKHSNKYKPVAAAIFVRVFCKSTFIFHSNIRGREKNSWTLSSRSSTRGKTIIRCPPPSRKSV